jgi:hypothetical protein
LFVLASSAAGQYGGYVPSYNMAHLGNGATIAPGYGTPPRYANEAPRISNQPPAYPVASYPPPGSSPTPYYPSYSPPYYQSPLGSALQGYSSLTTATGQYWNSIEQARILRQQANQAALDTQRKQIQFEQWYEQHRPTALTMAQQQKASSLDWARHDADSTQIWSGRPLNVLLQSILTAPNPTLGPHIYLDQSTVRGLNLTLPSVSGNLALAKNGGRIAWTETLQDSAFADVRAGFSKDFATAIKAALTGNSPPLLLIEALQAQLKALSATLDDQVQEITPDAYIGSRRLLNQLKATIQGLSSPLLCKTCSDTWKKSIHTVADVMKYCLDNGMQFGPAEAAGDYPAYTAFYYSLRNYERGIWQSPAQ